MYAAAGDRNGSCADRNQVNNDTNHTRSWSDSDIRKYLKGELSAREMHELERAALDDPFLADALEGLPLSSPLEGDMEELQARLAARLEEKPQQVPVIWFRRPAFRVAASVILLAGIGLTAYYSLLRHRSETLSNALVKRTATQPTPAEQVQAAPVQKSADTVTAGLVGHPAATQQPATAAREPAAAYSDSTKAYALNEKKLKKERRALTVEADQATSNYLTTDAARRRDANIKPDTTRNPDIAFNALPDIADAQHPIRLRGVRSEPVAKDTVTYNADLAKLKDKDAEGFASARAMPAMPSASFDKNLAFKTTPHPLSFSGRVLDINNQPLAGATVFLNNMPKIGATTDADGYFKFRLQPRDTSQQMTVSLVGYKQTLVALNSNALTNNIIHLEQAKPSLNEVVITGFGAKRKETYATAPSDDSDARLDSAWIKVYPVIGKLAYQKYLDSAKRSLRLDSTIYGYERVSFQVDQKGLITEFKIEQSLSPAHDASVIQLISGGPAWKLLRGKRTRAVVTVRFP